jgi:serine/threonine protein kinase
VKLLDVSSTTKENVDRFLAEARVLEALAHPHVVHAYAHGEQDGFAWYAMERLPASLRDHAKRKGPMPVALATAATMQVLSGLDAVHAQDLIHRDVKLTNVLVSAEGTVRVADFGVAHHPRGTVPFETIPGQGFGTPGYGAPEQWDGSHPVGPPADVFASGVLLYRLLTGRRPERLHMSHYRRELLDGLHPAIQHVLITATQVELEARYPSARTMAEGLAEARNAITHTDEATAWVEHLDAPCSVPGPGWEALTAWFKR